MTQNIVFKDDLEELKNIIDEIIAEEDPPLFNEEDDYLNFIETALIMMEQYIDENHTIITDPDFNEIFIEDVTELFYIQFENFVYQNESTEDDIDDLLQEAFSIFFTTIYQDRSSVDNEMYTIESNEFTKNIIENKLNYLRTLPQPVQRTPEWYQFRHNLITASNAYKAFESQSTINQLIYEKCQPIKVNDDKSQMVNVNSTFHWGQKYEPLSVQIYEFLNNTTIEDFGCIQHNKYNFLGASPDGINIDPKSEKYGRMLEIKNIVNREITGIPKKEYWVQTQLQMEVCDLDECDFLETKFVEYPDSASFFNDGQEKTEKNEYKGIIMYFNTKDAKPFYLYKPLSLTNNEDILKWEEDMLDKYQSSEHNMMWIKNHYWKLEKLSCVLILRNKKWFQDNIGQIENVWNIILKERDTGYQHRAPNKRVKKDTINVNTDFEGKGCLINIIKLH
jgi:putative phage-type endonuclease